MTLRAVSAHPLTFAGPAPRPPVAPAPRVRVLLVDATPNVELHTLQPLEAAGGEVLRATHTASALEILDAVRPGVVFVDAGALAQDPELCLRVRAHANGSVPLVLIADPEVSPETLEMAFQAGVDDCLLRPVRLAHVRSRLAAVAPTPSPVRPALSTAPRNLLLLDDDTDWQQVTGRLLELNGFHLLYGGSTFVTPPAAPMDLILLRSTQSAATATAQLLRLRKELGLTAPAILVCSGEVDGEASASAETTVLTRAAATPEAVLQRILQLFRRTALDSRAEARVPFFCPVEYREVGATQDLWSSCYSVDLSPGGIFLRTLVPARPRSALELRIRLTTLREDVSGTGVVAWANTYSERQALSYPIGMGVQFLGMSPRGLAQLRAICAASRDL